MKLKYLVAAAAALASCNAFAEVTGNVGVVSEYMFRGISQGDGGEPAVQGGLDYAGEGGFYAGMWGSNVDWGVGGTELDFYLGFGGEAGQITYDVGAVYYWYPEYEEEAEPLEEDPGTIELYASAGIGIFSLSYYYAPDKFFGIDDTAHYVNGAISAPVSDSVALDFGVGYSFGDAFDSDIPGEDDADYIDYSIALSKGFDNGASVSMALIGTDIDDDDIKFVIGAGYGFTL